ncbi:MAG: cupin domain-containing protein [Casimicrobiaceae bacterium]
MANETATVTATAVATERAARFSLTDGLQALAAAAPARSVALFRHGSLLVKYYAPRDADVQTPHMQDELYVVAHGSGIFFDGTTRRPFAPGDLLFAAAGVTHRFEEFTSDLALWVMFYGPDGGEVQ